MVTRLYFHQALNTLSNLPTTEQSSLTANANVDAQTVNRLMDTTIGTAQQSLVLTSNATVSLQRYYFTCFASLPLSGITSITAQTWTYNLSTVTNAAGSNFPVTGTNKAIRVTAYVWRPSTQTKVGDILDGNSALTVDITTTQRIHSTTFTGALVSSVVDGDVIVFEVWFEITQGLASALTDTFFYDGTTVNTTKNAVVTNHASFIETPQTLTFGTLSTNFTRALPTETVAISESLVRVADHPRAMTTETIPISESLQRTATNNRPLATQTTAISESLQRQYAANRLLATQTTAISESLTKLYTAIRPLALQTTTIGETSASQVTNTRALAVQTVTITEGLQRQCIVNRLLATQSTTISETLSEIYSAIRALPTQVVAISETSASQVVNTRALPIETISISESSARQYAANRLLPTETIPISETRAAVRTLSRALAVQSIGISEGLIRRYQANRPLPAETIPISESNFIVRTLTRALAETVTIAETLNRVFATARSLPVQTVTISESLTSLKTIVRALAAETIVIGEALTKVFTGIRALPPEDVSISETLSETYAATRVLPTQVVAVSETLARVCNVQRILATQTVTVGEVQSRLYAAARAIPTQVVSISETIAKVFTGNRALPAQTIVIAETLQTNKAFFRAAIETTAISETLARTFTGIRILDPETNSISDSSSRLYNANRPLAAQTVTISETLARLYAANRIQTTETVTITSGTLVRLLSTFRTRTETVPVTESLLRQFTGSRLLATQTTSISDSVAILYGLAPPPGVYERQMPLEIVAITESLNRVVTNSRLIPAETTAISESLIRAFSTVRLLPTQTVPISESVARQQALTRTAGLLSMTFDGVNDYLDLGTASVFDNLVTGFTWTILLTPTQGGTAYRTIIKNQSYPSAGGFELWYGGATPSQRYLEFKFNLNGINYFQGFGDIGINNKGLCVISWDNIAKKSFVKFGTFTSTSGVRPDNQTFGVGLGLQIARSASGFAGNIYEIRFFRRALTLAEISDIENNISALTPDFWLKMNEGTGTPIDSIAAVPVTNNGAGWTTENEIVPITESMTKQLALVRQVAQPSAVLFDGLNDYLNCGNDASLWSQPLTRFSFSIWVNPNIIGPSPENRNIVDHGWASAHSFLLYNVWNTSRYEFTIRTAALTSVIAGGTNMSITIGKWDNIVCTYDSTLGTDNIKMYLNGIQCLVTGNLTEILNRSSALFLGGILNEFGGTVRDFRWFTNKALTQTEIDDIYNNSISAPIPDYWLKMNEATGNPKDSITGTKTATLTNGASWQTNDTVPITESLIRRATTQRIISETIPITESQIRKYSSFRTLPIESVDISESSDRIYAAIRSFTENTAISETLERLVSIFRDLSDIVPISESLNKALILIRNLPAETTDITETLARKFTGNRIMPTQTITVGESLTKLYKGIRALPTQAVAISESVARLLAANRPLPAETISISEQLKRSFGTIRTLLATVSISESLQRLYSGSRYLVEDVDILESLRILAKLAKVAIFAPPALPQRRPETKGATNIQALHPNVDTLDYRTYLKENPPMSERKWSPASTQKRNKIETKNDLDDIDSED